MVSPASVGCTPMPKRGRADLHMHTTFSDGWPEPHQLVDHARSVGLDVIAVTDHDTIEGALRAADYAATLLPLHGEVARSAGGAAPEGQRRRGSAGGAAPDRKSTRLNSSHRCISYAVFCLKKKR